MVDFSVQYMKVAVSLLASTFSILGLVLGLRREIDLSDMFERPQTGILVGGVHCHVVGLHMAAIRYRDLGPMRRVVFLVTLLIND
jgi:hypothetical protein